LTLLAIAQDTRPLYTPTHAAPASSERRLPRLIERYLAGDSSLCDNARRLARYRTRRMGLALPAMS
jgi:hypothetical protein